LFEVNLLFFRNPKCKFVPKYSNYFDEGGGGKSKFLIISNPILNNPILTKKG